MENTPPKKPTTKEERRALQEKQRAEKLARKQAQQSTQQSQPKQPKQPKPQQQQQPPQQQPPQQQQQQSTQQQPQKHPQQQSQKPPKQSGALPSKKEVPPRSALQFDDNKKSAKAAKRQILPLEPSQKNVSLFSHLPQYERATVLGVAPTNDIPSYIIQLGCRFMDRTIIGSTARTASMLLAFKNMIEDFTCSTDGEFHKELDVRLRNIIQFLVDCRPLSLSMGNAINYLKSHIGLTRRYQPEMAKQYLVNKIDTFLYERIVCAIEFIAGQAVSKIKDGDVILTYSRSQSVEAIIARAHQEKINFKVIIVDSDPLREGKVLLKNLVKLGIECTYTMINAVSYVMNEATKVILGASAVLSNGTVVSRAGTALVALVANARRVPVMVACETFKFSERVQLDCITYNELGNPDGLLSTPPLSTDLSSINKISSNQSTTSSSTSSTSTPSISSISSTSLSSEDIDEEPLKNWRDIPSLKLLNLAYDLTPTSSIDLLITDLGLLPPTSVPVILREYKKDPQL